MQAPGFLKHVKACKIAVYLIGFIPLAALVARMVASPPADPYESIAHVTGETALRLLLLTLLVSPLRDVLGWKRVGPLRRTLGVLTFCYAIFHMLAYVVFEAEFSFGFVIDDVADRRFIAVGMAAFVMMVPLGLTSNNWSVCKLGKNWKKLHFMVFPLALCACLHFLWLKRGEDLSEPLFYLFAFLALFAFRIGKNVRSRMALGESRSA